MCGETEHLDVDHKIPVAAGGGWDYGNLWLLCDACHRQKTFRHVARHRQG
ncbi:HNH endonuclease signature motif containing protein [Actinomadura rubrisoli]